MGNQRTINGVPWHVGTVFKEEDDPRRHKSRCYYYNKNTRTCRISKGMKCIGSAHCSYYKEVPVAAQNMNSKNETKAENQKKKQETNTPVVPVKLPEKQFAKWKCPYAKVGARVRHTKEGEGIVREVKKDNIVVYFPEKKAEKIFNIEVTMKIGCFKLIENEKNVSKKPSPGFMTPPESR